MLARLSIKVKLTGLVVIIVSVASLTFGRFATGGLLNMMERAAGYGARTAAEGLAATVDGKWLEAVRPGDDTTSADGRLQEQFTAALSQGYVRRVYLVRYTSKDRVEHIFGLPADGTPDYFAPGALEPASPGTTYASKNAGYAGAELATPGSFLAGWAPIRNGSEIVGQLGLVVDGSEVQGAIDKIILALIAIMFAFIALSGLTAYKFAASFEKTAVTDGLMGIYNHKFFKQRLEDEVAKSRRYGQQTSVVLLDIDFFKRVNDTYGHATGDIVLKNLAKWVQDSTRTTDVVARYGGEEIGVILPFTGLAGAQEFAERLRMRISQQVVQDPGENAEFRVTVSVGVAQWEKGVTMIDLIKRADAALYHSKHSGRNRVSIYHEDLLPATEPAVASAKK